MFEVFNETKDDVNINDINLLLKKSIKFLDIENALFNVIIVNDDKIHEINKKYRNIDKSTDVISFALEDADKIDGMDIRVLGDIYVSIDTARRQAYEYYNTEEEEIRFLVIHGLLHLLGFDHMNKADETKMMELEERVLINYDPKRSSRKDRYEEINE